MCGIFFHLSNREINKETLREYGEKINHRGPDSTVELMLNDKVNMYFLFHRLAINGLNEKGNQPMEIGNKILMCNGEIYNYTFRVRYPIIYKIIIRICMYCMRIYIIHRETTRWIELNIIL